MGIDIRKTFRVKVGENGVEELEDAGRNLTAVSSYSSQRSVIEELHG